MFVNTHYTLDKQKSQLIKETRIIKKYKIYKKYKKHLNIKNVSYRNIILNTTITDILIIYHTTSPDTIL